MSPRVFIANDFCSRIHVCRLISNFLLPSRDRAVGMIDSPTARQQRQD